MIKVDLKQATLDACVNEAQREPVILTRNGKPVALIIGIEGLDEEQFQLGSSDRFWRLITERRMQKAISRAELEHKINSISGNSG